MIPTILRCSWSSETCLPRTVILLDRVQKRQHISKDDVAVLRSQGLVEGRFPNVFVAAHVASIAGDKARYIRNRAFDDQHYKEMILKYLQQYRGAGRREIDVLLLDKLSDVLNERQRRNKVKNLLSALAKEGLVTNAGSRRYPRWMVTRSGADGSAKNQSKKGASSL